MKTQLKFTLLLALLSASTLLSAQSIECFVIAPPEKPLVNVKKIAIMNFSNFDNNTYYNSYGGSAFVNYLTAKLLDENRGIYSLSGGLFGGYKEGKTYIKSSGINVFQIVEREQLSNVLREKNFGTEVTLDDNQAAEVGKVLGIDALITGTVKHIYNSNRTTVKLGDGSSAFSTENTCSTEITMKLVSVSNGQIMATKTFKYNSNDKKWGRDEGNVLGFEQLAESNMKAIALATANYISPSYNYYKADFRKIKTSEFKNKNDDLKKYIENADFVNIYSIYKAIFDADNYNADVAYNLALLSVITGDYKGAANWDRTACEVDSKEFGKAKEWADYWDNTANLLNNIGVTIDKIDFASQINGNALAAKVKTKGNKSDRFEVYEKPDNGSVVLAKVPGETEFIIIEKNGSFTKIKLLGGKEGFISNENTKK